MIRFVDALLFPSIFHIAANRSSTDLATAVREGL